MTTIRQRLQQSEGSAVRGIGLLLFAFFIFTIQDVIVKLISGDYALLQIVVIRTVLCLPIVFGVLQFNGGLRSLRTGELKLEIMRGLSMFFAYIFFFMALSALPYSINQAIFFSAPLFITALSVPLLSEHVGWRRWVAVFVGFAGVLIVVDPSGGGYDPAVIFAILSAFTYALSIVTTRKMGDHPSVITVYTALVYLLGGITLSPIFIALNSPSSHPSLQFLMRDWQPMKPNDVLLIALIAIIWGLGMVLLTTAYRDTPVAILAPFEYFAVVYGLLFGFLVWREVPTLRMLIGIVLIVGSGLFIIYRENKVEVLSAETSNPS